MTIQNQSDRMFQPGILRECCCIERAVGYGLAFAGVRPRPDDPPAGSVSLLLDAGVRFSVFQDMNRFTP